MCDFYASDYLFLAFGNILCPLLGKILKIIGDL